MEQTCRVAGFVPKAVLGVAVVELADGIPGRSSSGLSRSNYAFPQVVANSIVAKGIIPLLPQCEWRNAAAFFGMDPAGR
jgi:hypothetical protein